MERQTSRFGSSSSRKRLHNILWVKDLDREGLRFNAREKQLLIHKTASGESLYIQYPGRETTSDRYRPWDFRPKLQKDDGSYGVDLDFGMIWDILSESLKSSGPYKDELARVLARLFYGMAYMQDHEIQEGQELLTRYLELTTDGPDVIDVRFEMMRSFYVYKPIPEVVQIFSDILPDLGGMSLEGFLFYNDILAWNEDCKYYYREVEENGRNWHAAKGRPNNLLTHVSLLGWLIGDIRLSEFLLRFSRMRGVSPATFEEVKKTCRDLVV